MFVENSPILTSRGLGRVLGDLAAMGYDARWGVLGGKHVGAPIIRDRIWIRAGANGVRRRELLWNKQDEREIFLEPKRLVLRKNAGWNGEQISAEEKSKVLGMVDGMARGLDRIKACGNGQVPILAALAWEVLR